MHEKLLLDMGLFSVAIYVLVNMSANLSTELVESGQPPDGRVMKTIQIKRFHTNKAVYIFSSESPNLLCLLSCHWSCQIPYGILTHYSLYVNFTNGSDLRREDTRDGDTTSHTLTHLQPFQLVVVQVSASTSVGEGPRSIASENRTLEAGECAWTPCHSSVLLPLAHSSRESW